MHFHQLELDLGEAFTLPDKATPPDKRDRRRVYPTDITRFIDHFLPEYREGLRNGTLTEGPFRFPKLEAVHNVEPRTLVPFNAVMSFSRQDVDQFTFFHFFVHDYQFERMWAQPDKYLPFLKQIGQGIGPDYSMYLYMHPAELIINKTRNFLAAFYLQKHGLPLIPNACCGDAQTLDWAFDGLPEHSVLALSSQSCMKDGIAKQALLNGIHTLVRQKHPEKLLVYGDFPDQWKDKFGVEIDTLPTFASKWRRAC